MQEARMLGNYVKHLADAKGLTSSDLGQILGCSVERVCAFFKGRVFVSFSQLTNLAQALDITVEKLLNGDVDRYNATVVHCMNDFDDVSKREDVLDLIDNYVDIADAIAAQKYS